MRANWTRSAVELVASDAHRGVQVYGSGVESLRSVRGRCQTVGRQLLHMYKELGLDLTMGGNAVEAGISRVCQRLSSGRPEGLPILAKLAGRVQAIPEDEKGQIVKERDHLMDATRYLEMELLNIVRSLSRRCTIFGETSSAERAGGCLITARPPSARNR